MKTINHCQSAKVTHISAARTPTNSRPVAQSQSTQPVRKFVPFNGFDGQYLAGSGALVFEGELLKTRH